MKSENNIVEGALKVHKLTFWEAAMIIVGAKHRVRHFRTGLFGQKSRLAGIDAVADHSRIFYDGVNAVCG